MPRYAFVGQPETDGVIERFFGTLKAQVVHGRVFETLEDVRDAVRAVIARTNAAWLIEKNGDLSPKASAETRTFRSDPWPRNPAACPRNRVRFS